MITVGLKPAMSDSEIKKWTELGAFVKRAGNLYPDFSFLTPLVTVEKELTAAEQAREKRLKRKLTAIEWQRSSEIDYNPLDISGQWDTIVLAHSAATIMVAYLQYLFWHGMATVTRTPIEGSTITLKHGFTPFSVWLEAEQNASRKIEPRVMGECNPEDPGCLLL